MNYTNHPFQSAMKRKRSELHSFDIRMPPAILLCNKKRLVECSFLVERSLTYLDLNTGEFSNFKQKAKRHYNCSLLNEPMRLHLVLDFFNDLKVIQTEESFKKRFAPNRKVLYDFHLDVSKELEHNLRGTEHRKQLPCYSDFILLNKIVPDHLVYEESLAEIIAEALEDTNEKLTLISHVSKMAKHLTFLSKVRYIQDRGLEILCSEGPGIAILKDYMTVMRIGEKRFYTRLSTDSFNLYLHHANHAGYDLRSMLFRNDPLHSTIFIGTFKKAESLFQYIDGPRYSDRVYNVMKKCEGWFGCKEDIEYLVAHVTTTKERCFLIFEILIVFTRNRNEGLKTLQMLWRSIRNPYITLDELTSVLHGLGDFRKNERLHDFIKNVTGQVVLEERGLQPRKLKHYCRIEIRSVLSNNKQLATGIEKLKLPPAIKSFLRLENYFNY